MNEKPFKLGLVLGRFQTFHLGHEDIINKAIALCDTVAVFVGSSQESGTLKNPFTYEKREKILRKVFGDKIDIFPLADIGVGNNGKWGDYVIENVRQHYDQPLQLLVSGKETRRIDWFDGVDGLSIAELYVAKTIDISATLMREHLINDDFDSFKQYTNEKLWDEYDYFKTVVKACKDVTHTDSV